MDKKKVLIAVLNWGLGHATRCIPIIQAMETSDIEPVIASDGPALVILEKAFPHLDSFELPSYKITYPENGNLRYHLVRKSPGLIKTLLEEQKAIRGIVKNEKISAILSDNRPGARYWKIPSVYLTHQVSVFSGNSTFISTAIHRHFINKFDQCWIPDCPGKHNLSGKMSEGKLRVPKKFLGIYSRFKKSPRPVKYELTVLLSGPEPQRSLLEKILFRELNKCNKRILFVRGKAGIPGPAGKNKEMEIHDHLSGDALEQALNESSLIIARPGYSTILDLAVLGKKAFFIPTPGQYEQQYIAGRMKSGNIAPYCQQKDFTLEKIAEADRFKGFSGFNLGESEFPLGFFKGE